jgi:hypothetical protein
MNSSGLDPIFAQFPDAMSRPSSMASCRRVSSPMCGTEIHSWCIFSNTSARELDLFPIGRGQVVTGMGAAQAEDFDADMMTEYRRAWRNPEMIHGSCSDYRAAGTVDLEHDTQDLNRRVRCPALRDSETMALV